MSHVAIIDYGMGNLRSVSRALEKAAEGKKISIKITNNPQVIKAAERVVFPGVGAIRDCMQELRNLNLESTIRECAANKPFLGVCLGMQALFEFSEENEGTPCFGIVPGKVCHFSTNQLSLKIPHMGWNIVHQQYNHPLWQDIPQNSRFYFVHSYYIVPQQSSLITGTTDYITTFASAFTQKNIFLAQFHPEKSQQLGVQFLTNFLTWNGTT
ncbi:imidazole glycerol phosphate synthase subunit HisH [Candidatus Nitrosacidococcus sp. I8]|uniref:imidazole glycerol phosphate synthase subunit HisH n=1 Tax=Candidatus Nitrosacidococcus sp. I8 TaxID=2942908 RepID=UPI002227FBAB|nr:imidazole glycerol phosphate synthase subunit HisH [Candidatus Nitrosacidococcus sp. I8]CAH9019866.1 Imidazole glycerol phosphate synthase subunit HisH [Candidatus Nitrosacidococcus sp. I8]